MIPDRRFQGYFPGVAKHGHQGCWNEKNGFVQCEGCGWEFLDCKVFRDRLGLSLRYTPTGGMTDLSLCPKCGNLLVVGDVDDVIAYVRVLLKCESVDEGQCDFVESREIGIKDIREHGTLEEEEQ